MRSAQDSTGLAARLDHARGHGRRQAFRVLSKALRKQPEYGQPEGSAEQKGDEDAPGGTQPIIALGFLGRLDKADCPDDLAVSASVEEVRNIEVLEWPVYEGPSGHAPKLARRGPAASGLMSDKNGSQLEKMAEIQRPVVGWRSDAGWRTVRGVRQPDTGRRSYPRDFFLEESNDTLERIETESGGDRRA